MAKPILYSDLTCSEIIYHFGKDHDAGKYWRQKKGATEDEMVR